MFPPLLVLARHEIRTKPASLPIYNVQHRLGEGTVVLIDGLLIVWWTLVLERDVERNRTLRAVASAIKRYGRGRGLRDLNTTISDPTFPNIAVPCVLGQVAGFNNTRGEWLTFIYVSPAKGGPWSHPWNARNRAAEWVHGREEGRKCWEMTKVAKGASNLVQPP